MQLSADKRTTPCVTPSALGGAILTVLLMGPNACREVPDAQQLRVDRLEAGTLNLRACDWTTSSLDGWSSFAFASGAFEISLPPGTIVSDSGSWDRWNAPGMIWISARVDSNARDQATARATEYSQRRTADHRCVARSALGASVASVWEGELHPAGFGTWGVARWYLPDEREVAVIVQAPLGTDLAILRTIIQSIRPVTSSR